MYPANYYSPNYNGYMPMPAPQTPPVQQAPQMAVNQGVFQWVKGEDEAKNYLVAPNTSVMLMDSENKCFYIKSADSMGMAQPMRIFDFKERAQNTTSGEFVTRDEFEKRLSELTEKSEVKDDE